MTAKILFVDDDANILSGIRRQLRGRYEIDTALCGDEGLKAVSERGPFAVVVSDMRMPGMDGIQFLTRVQEQAADSVRVMLTGNADQQTAVKAVNQGRIFRFLNKPCSVESLTCALDSSLEQHRLITAERELLSETLSGSVKVLTEVLSLTSARAFGRTAEIRALVRQITEGIELAEVWEVELAASLCQIGHVTVPESILDRFTKGLPLNEHERSIFENHAAVGSRLVANIPRLKKVAKLIAYQCKSFDGSGPPDDGLAGEAIPLGARILRLAIDFDALRSHGKTIKQAQGILAARRGKYDPELLKVLGRLMGIQNPWRDVGVSELTEEMVLEEHLCTDTGEVLVAAGRQLTRVMLEKLQEFARKREIREPIRIRTTNTCLGPEQVIADDGQLMLG